MFKPHHKSFHYGLIFNDDPGRPAFHIKDSDFVKPAQIHAFLRKKGTTLEEVNWYNRVCVKYVVEGDPEDDIMPNVAMTAVEVTLGPDIVPAGRECAFTAGAFQT